MTLEQYKAKLQSLTNLATEMKDANTNDGELVFANDADKAQFKTYLTEIKTVNAKIKELEEDQALLSTLDASVNYLDQSKGQLPSDAKVVNSGIAIPDGKKVLVTQTNIELDPKNGFRNHADFLRSVINQTVGRKTDKRLDNLKSDGSDMKFVSGANDGHATTNDPYGGFLVPEAFSPTELSTAPEQDPTSGRTRAIPMEVPTVKFNARVDKDHSTSVSGGLVVYRRAEQESVTYENQQREQISMNANMLIGASFATNELIADSPVSLAALLEQGFRDEFSSKIFNEKLNGTGAGQYEGIMNSAALITIAKEGSQAADTIVGQNIIKMRSRCWNYGNAIWLANHDTYPQLIQAHIESATPAGIVSVYQPSLQEDRPDMLLGRPIFYTEYCSTLGDLGDIVLADWSQFLEGTLQNFESAVSTHVKFVTHEQVFKFTMRNDGRSWWKSVLTPKNGSTLSPFITLAERA